MRPAALRLLRGASLNDFYASLKDFPAATGPLVRRAALGLLRVAARLLAANDDVADALLRSLNLLPRLHPNVAWELAEPIAQQARCCDK